MSEKLFLLWDESQLWGLLFLHTLQQMQIPFRLISAAQIKNGLLQKENPTVCIVPGGWAKLKALALGDSGKEAIRNWVKNGGTYLGICGGAGLGLSSKHGGFLDFCSWKRQTGAKRLPNFSGYLLSELHAETRIISLPVWWPSQFSPQNGEIEIIASYKTPDSDFWVSDLYLPQKQNETVLTAWENHYGIQLNPTILQNEPCIIRGKFGSGTFILSYPHLETPNSPDANALLANLLRDRGFNISKTAVSQWRPTENLPENDGRLLHKLLNGLQDCIFLGERNFLLFWRYPWLLGWRRGVPGSLVSTIFTMTCQALRWTDDLPPKQKTKVENFINGLRKYLLAERLVFASSPSSPQFDTNDKLQELKQKLFGKFPGYGGLYGQIIHELDKIIFQNVTNGF